jgi:hypothetical protein
MVLRQRRSAISLGVRQRPQLLLLWLQIHFRHETGSLYAFMTRAIAGIGPGDSSLAVMEPTGMSWFPVAHRLADSGIAT